MDTSTPKLIPPYQRLAEYYDELMDYIDYEAWTGLIVDGIHDITSGKKVLDVSCGTGTMCHYFDALGYEITGVDSSEQMINFAKQKYSNLNFLVGDMRNWQSGSERYDVILNVHDGLNYLKDSSDILSFMQQAKSMLSKNGVLIFDVATPSLCRQHFKEFVEIHATDNNVWERHTKYDSRKRIVYSDFLFLDTDGNAEEKESHLQYAYDINAVKSFLELSPFRNWTILDEENLEPADDRTQRLIVFAQ